MNDALKIAFEEFRKIPFESIPQRCDVDLDEGRIRIRHQVIGYEKKGLFDRQRFSRHDLDMPECVFETEGIWLKHPEKLMAELKAEGFEVAGTLHAFEHAAISTLPLFALCDKGDIGGLSYELYPEFGVSTIFIYDGQEVGYRGMSLRGRLSFLRAGLPMRLGQPAP